MLYITCTISREENEEIVQSCLAANKSLRLENLNDQAPAWGRDLIDKQGYLRTFPHEHEMDGFFAALFVRK